MRLRFRLAPRGPFQVLHAGTHCPGSFRLSLADLHLQPPPSTRWATERIIPRTAGLSGKTALRPILRNPSLPDGQFLWFGAVLMPLRIKVTLSFLAMV